MLEDLPNTTTEQLLTWFVWLLPARRTMSYLLASRSGGAQRQCRVRSTHTAIARRQASKASSAAGRTSSRSQLVTLTTPKM